MSLLSEYKLGDLALRNRMVMAPITRCWVQTYREKHDNLEKPGYTACHVF